MSKTPSVVSQEAQQGPSKSAHPPLTPTIECRYCHQWETSLDDGYCAFCGHALLALEVKPEALILISTLAPQKELTFRSTSQQKLQVVVVPRKGPKFPALTFEPSGSFDIAPNQEVRTRVTLDAGQLPADFQERELDYVCLVNNDSRKQLSLKITVRSGPRPKLLSPVLQFGDVQEGTVVERALEIANNGGIPLNVREVRPEGSGRLRLREGFAPTLVQPGRRLAIPVLWDGHAADEVEAGSSPAGVRVTFGNYPESLFVPARARSFRFLLALKPISIQLPRVLVKQDYSVRVEIENQGTANLEISSIESDQPWLEVASRAKSFTLLCEDASVGRSGDVSPTTFARTYIFMAVCHPQRLPAGKHQGRVTIRIVGQESKSVSVVIDVLHPKPYPDYIGIDFGTSNSVVALLNKESYEVELVEDGPPGSPPSPLIPSVLVFEDADTYIIGQAARNAMNTAPDRSVRSIKRIMGYDKEREFFGRRFSPEDLASRIIRKLVQLAERKLYADWNSYFDVSKAIITVPANFFDLQIRGILNACESAGLDTEEVKVKQAAQKMLEVLGQAVTAGIILDEPSAAILYYIYSLSQNPGSSEIVQAIDREEGLRLLVFDYGGGTLDVSVANVIRLKSGEAGVKILANMGDNGIGGDSIDLVLMQEILKRCKDLLQPFDFDTRLIGINFQELEAKRDREAWSGEIWRQVLRARMSWKDLSEKLKIQLAEREHSEVEILPDDIVVITAGKLIKAPRGVKISVPRSVLETLLQGVLDKSNRLVNSALDLAGISHEQVDYIFHTGRQSLMPLIRQRVHEIFPNLPSKRDILDPQHLKVCVAKGAALYGWMRDKLVDPKARIHLLSEGRRLPHSYGVEKFANFLQPEFDEILPRGTPYPTFKEQEYGPEMIPSSGYLNLKFYQNAGTRKAILRNPQISLIGQISFNTLANGKPGCLVRFVIDANRKLEVFADDQAVELQPVRLHGEESWMG